MLKPTSKSVKGSYVYERIVKPFAERYVYVGLSIVAALMGLTLWWMFQP